MHIFNLCIYIVYDRQCICCSVCTDDVLWTCQVHIFNLCIYITYVGRHVFYLLYMLCTCIGHKCWDKWTCFARYLDHFWIYLGYTIYLCEYFIYILCMSNCYMGTFLFVENFSGELRIILYITLSRAMNSIVLTILPISFFKNWL